MLNMITQLRKLSKYLQKCADPLFNSTTTNVNHIGVGPSESTIKGMKDFERERKILP